jgi:hypothetical protein
MLISELLPLATFLSPENIPTNAVSLLWILPLAASISLVYKATKLPTISAWNFVKETAVLFGSVLVFLLISGMILYAIDRFILQ